MEQLSILGSQEIKKKKTFRTASVAKTVVVKIRKKVNTKLKSLLIKLIVERANQF